MSKFEVDVSVSENGKRHPKYSINSDLSGEQTLEDILKHTKTSLILIADAVLKEEQAKGFDSNPVILIDNKKGRTIESVSPLGKIDFISRQTVDTIIVEAYEEILKKSKVLTGAYKNSHAVIHNNVVIAYDLSSLTAWFAKSPNIKNKDVFRIVNTQPYARRLELLGVTADRQQARKGERDRASGRVILRLPNGAYQLTLRAIRRKYKGNMRISFTFIPGTGLGLSGAFKTGKKNAIGRPYLYPALTFRVEEGGVTDV